LKLASPLIHIWVPDIDSAKGGIQAFSRFFIQAVAEALPDARISVFSKNDYSTPAWLAEQRSIDFECAGWWSRTQRTPAFSWRIARAAWREKPAAILSTHANFAPVARWLKKFKGIRYGVVAHGVDVWGARNRRLSRALRDADRILAVSHFTRERMLAEMTIDQDKIGVLPNTFASEIFAPAPKAHYLLKRFGLNSDQPVILTVARLASEERYKGYDQMLRILPAVRRAVPGVRYILAGSGPDRARIEALARNLSIEDAVTLAGYVPDHELPAFYNLSEVFAMPSKGEGFGIVFLEALGCGKPVIAGNKDGSVDAVLNGEVGVLVDPDDLPGIEEALIAILLKRHPLKILQQPEQLRARVIDAYGYPQFVRKVAEQLALLGLEA
jgi:glycosyltransferase involved in cell wall biosynthesis